MSLQILTGDCYDFPQYWDLAFRSETLPEADFVDAVARKYCDFPVRSVLEPGCGGGRLVVELADRGYAVTGYDLSSAAIRYVQARLRRRSLAANVCVGNMIDFRVCKPFDLAINTVNTFRHLLTQQHAVSHLLATAEALRPGGVYILAFHLLPPDADEDDEERWSARHGPLRVHMTLRVVSFDRRKRRERLRFSLRVRSPTRDLRICSEYDYRIYTAAQFRHLLRRVPQFELCDVYDFWYDINDPLRLNDELGDTVFVLRRV